ncbi:MAG: NAD(P)/FAD-dependent oxidoreductase [Candidatus Lokiarchaeota archaeon]|nr:NAD(P)/FAD-dependent oxidoreductase [Candidatus Lokiarchaeota archaeon]
MFDVVISGAGPSGSHCAKILTEAGFRVALIEKNTRWRKPCGGAVHSSVVDLYPQLKKLSSQKVTGVVMHSADYHRLEFEGSSDEFSIIVDRLELDNIMRDAALDAGAELFDNNVSYDFVVKNSQKMGVKTKSQTGTKEYRGKIIVIADGMSSKLAIKSGIRTKWINKELAIGKCAIIEGNHHLNLKRAYVFFTPFQGYGWIFPLNPKKYNIGIFTFGKDNLKHNIHQDYKNFVENTNITKLIPKSNKKVIWSSVYPFPAEGVLEKSLFSENVMIIGDAGGFVSPISGEGIQSAVISGQIAAETAINALRNEDYSNISLKNFRTNKEIKSIIRNFKLKLSMINFLYEHGGSNLNKMFKLSEIDSEFREQVVNMFAFGLMPSKEFLEKVHSS